MTCSLKNIARSLARSSERSEAEVLNYHLLEGVLKRLSKSNHVNSLVLRGGMLTRLWVAAPSRRVAIDLDFLGLYPFDIEVTLKKFQEILGDPDRADEIVFDLDSLAAKGIWLNTESPGVRVNINAVICDYQNNVQIDVGFNDPLTIDPQWIDYPLLLTKETIKVLAVTVETAIAWKMDGLVEMGQKNWRPKDLYDLMLFSEIEGINEADLIEAIIVAFKSRDRSPQILLEIFSTPTWWNNHKNRSKWKWYRRKFPENNIAEDYPRVVKTVLETWKPILEKTIARQV